MAIRVGSLGGLGLAVESVYGTAETTPDDWLNVLPGASLGMRKKFFTSEALGTVGAGETRTGTKWADGPARFLLSYLAWADGDMWHELMHHVFGAVTGAGTGASPFTFTIDEDGDGSNPTGFTGFKDIGGKIHRQQGLKARSMNIVLEPGFVPIEMDFIGQDEDEIAALTINALAETSLVDDKDVTTLTLNGNDLSYALKGGNINMGIPYTGDDRADFGVSTIPEPVRNGRRTIEGTLNLEVSTAAPDVETIIDNWRTDTSQGDLVLSFGSGNPHIQFTVSALKAVGDPVTLDAGVSMYSMAFRSTSMELEVQNAA